MVIKGRVTPRLNFRYKALVGFARSARSFEAKLDLTTISPAKGRTCSNPVGGHVFSLIRAKVRSFATDYNR